MELRARATQTKKEDLEDTIGKLRTRFDKLHSDTARLTDYTIDMLRTQIDKMHPDIDRLQDEVKTLQASPRPSRRHRRRWTRTAW